MAPFEFAFSLFGLVFGLSVVEIVGGLSRVLRARDRVRIGWLTPLLGLLLLFDVVTFWSGTWGLRDRLPINFTVLIFGTLVASVYYLSASLVFPTDVERWPDLDEYYRRYRRLVLAGPLATTIAGAVSMVTVFAPPNLRWETALLGPGSAALVFVALMLVANRWISIALMLIGLSFYFLI